MAALDDVASESESDAERDALHPVTDSTSRIRVKMSKRLIRMNHYILTGGNNAGI